MSAKSVFEWWQVDAIMLGKFLSLHPATVTRAGLSEEWPYIEDSQGGGRFPRRVYEVQAVPNRHQTAWALSAEISQAQAQEALKWPLRESYYRPRQKVWDGHSRGLCPAARAELLKRFPQLAHIQPGSVPPREATENPARPAKHKGYGADRTKGGTVQVLYLETVLAAAGGGIYNEDHPAAVALEMSEDLLELLAPGIPAKGLMMIKARGDSMEPEIGNGDKLLLAPADGVVFDGGIYVVRVGDTVAVKRVYKNLGGGSLELISSNSRYAPVTLAGSELENFSIIAQVVGRLRIDQL